MGSRADGDDGQARHGGPQRSRSHPADSLAGPGPDIVEEVVTFEPPHLLGYKALSGTPFPGYAGEVRLSEAGAGTHISYTISSTASFPLVKAPLAMLCQVLLRLLARASMKRN